MDALLAVSFQVQYLRRTSARKMAGSVQERQQVVAVALTPVPTHALMQALPTPPHPRG
jgi:hypothetical protein